MNHTSLIVHDFLGLLASLHSSPLEIVEFLRNLRARNEFEALLQCHRLYIQRLKSLKSGIQLMESQWPAFLASCI